jgi:transglutaminase-like putative cysteine protease
MSRTFERTLLAVTVAVTAAAAIACMAARGLLPLSVVALAVALTCLAAWTLLRWPTGRGAVIRRQVAHSVVAVVMPVSALALLVRLRSSDGDPDELVRVIGTTMSYPLTLLVLAQLGSAGSLRDLGGVLVGSGLCALLALGTMPDPAETHLGSALSLFLAVTWTAGLMTLWLMHRAKERSRATHCLTGRGPSLRGIATLVVGSVLVGLAVLQLLPHPDGVRPAEAVGGRDLATAPSEGGAAEPRSPSSYLSPGMDLDSRGELPTTPLVEVPADSPTLWGSTVMVTYTGRTWGPREPLRAGLPVPGDALGNHDLRRGVVEGSPAGLAERTDQVRPVAPDVYLPLLAPGQPVSVRLAGEVGMLGDSLFFPVTAGQPYLMRSTGVITDPVSPADTALPTSVPDRVRDLARRLTSRAATTEAKVAAIETYLRAELRYRLDSPVPDEDEDAVDDFIFESREGFCEHFASAEAVLLRAVGVPARVVTGFAGGTVSGESRILRGSDAHAWVQVHVGGGTWLWTDPTAGATLAADHPDAAERLLSFLREHGMLLGAVALGSAALGLTVFLAVRRVRRRRDRARALAAPVEARVLAAFATLEAALDGTGLARSPEASVQEMTGTLLADWPGGLPGDQQVVAALAVVERILYDGRPVTEDEARAALSALEELTDHVREAGLVTTARRP